MTTDTAITTVTSSTPHSHHAQDQAVAVTKLRATLKESAADGGTLSQLVADKTTHVPVNIRGGLLNQETVKRALRCEHARHVPKNPASYQLKHCTK